MKKLFAPKYSSAVIVAILIFVFLGASSGVAFAQQATAAQTQTPANYSCSIFTLPTCLVIFITYIVNQVLTLFISLGGWLIQVGLQLSTNVYNSPFVQSGFGVSLSLANLGFVLVIIIIAIATILKSETYGYKKTLWRLVVMAILINFGLVITAPIVNFANGITTYFQNAITGGINGPAAFVNQITQAANPGAADQPPVVAPAGSAALTTECDQAKGAIDSAAEKGDAELTDQELQQICAQAAQKQNSANSGFMQSVMALIFASTFELVIVIAFLSIGALMFVRYIWLALLLVLLPLAWLMWIFPKFGAEFGKWWNNFIKWSFFPPAAMFFIWLALTIQKAGAGASGYLGQVGATGMNGVSIVNTAPTAIVAATGQVGLLNQFMANIVTLGIMVGGLMAASKLAGSAGSFAVAQAKGVSNSITGYVGRKTKAGARTGSRYATDRLRGMGRKYDPDTHETTTWLQRRGSQLQNVPVLRGAGAAIARGSAPENIKKGREEDIQKYIDNNLKALTNDGVLKRANSTTAFVNPTAAAALAQEIARRDLTGNDGDPGKIGTTRMKQFVGAAERLGNLEKVTANRPDLMPLREKSRGVMETKEEAIERAVKGAKGDIIQANPEAFKYVLGGSSKIGMTDAQVKRAILSLSNPQLTTLGSDTSTGSQARQNNLTDAIKEIAKAFKKEITVREEILDAKKKGTNTYRDKGTGKYEFDDAKFNAEVVSNPDLKNLKSIVKHMESSSSWGSVLN